MYLSDMEAELYDHFGWADPQDQAVINRVRRNINLAYRGILGMKGLSKLRRAVLTFASVAGTPFAVLPQAASRLIVLQDRTNNITLDELDLKDVRFDDPGLRSSSAVPYGYVIENLAAPVAQDPSTPTELFVISTHANDGVGVAANVSGIITGGYQRTVSGPMNGVVSTTVDASITSWTNVSKFNLSAPARGIVRLTQGQGGGELAQIAIGKSSARYSRIMLHPVPLAVLTYYVDVELNIEDLTSPTDEPVLPLDWHWLLTSGAMMREYAKREKHNSWTEERARFRDGVGDMRVFLSKKSGVPQQQGGVRHSQLGSYFPPGT